MKYLKYGFAVLLLFCATLHFYKEEDVKLCFYKITPVEGFLNKQRYETLEKIQDQIFLDIGQQQEIASYPIQEKKNLYLAGECNYINPKLISLDRREFNVQSISSDKYIEKFNANIKGIKIVD